MITLSKEDIEKISDDQVNIIRNKILSEVSPPSNDKQWLHFMDDVIGFAFSYGVGYTMGIMEENLKEFDAPPKQEDIYLSRRG
jgi:hypothetical protein